MNKLTALSKLSSAYHYLFLFPTGAEQDALDILSDKFHYIRRSLTMLDLAPQSKSTEGMNPKGPTFF
jgi:hypothetical protein